MTTKSILAAVAVIFLSLSPTLATAHPGEHRASSPTDHEHYHCHHAQQCHSHGHDGAHH
jgi:hypothetical protein